MSAEHRSATFYNTCVKMPIAPDQRPATLYERAPTRDKRGYSSLSIRDTPPDCARFGLDKDHLRCESVQSDEGEEKSSVFNMADFYESIPDYNDMHHLSESDFYGQLEGLKRKQAILKSNCLDASPREEVHHGPAIDCDTVQAAKISFCDDNFAMYPSPSRLGMCGKKPRSKSAGSLRQKRTVFSPFKMTQREDDDNIRREMMLYRNGRCASADPRCSPKRNRSQSKGLNVPYTSKYPMYDQIVADQLKRSQIVKLNSKIELQSKMKPFHFFTNKSTKCSDDAESLLTFKPLSPRSFRAKPCPRHMFSNYFHHKMWEDEQFRAMNRKIRAEELLKASSLPASMRKRQVTPKCVPSTECGASEISPSEASFNKRGLSSKKRSKRTKRKVGGSSRMVTPDQSGFITTSPSPFEFETAKRSSSRKFDKNSDAASSVTMTEKDFRKSDRSTPKPIYPAARPNLAANLREEWSRKKICEMSCAPKKPFPRDTTVRPNWGVRKTPAWKSLYYDYTNDEDISMRLSTRRAEERLRQEEHHFNMELMRQRVKATPLLLEGQTSLPNTLTSGGHQCDPPSHRVSSCSVRRAQSAQQTQTRGHSRNVSVMSNYSDSQCGSMKDRLSRKIRRSIDQDRYGAS